MDSIYGIPNEPIVYFDKEIGDVHYCKKCDEAIPLSRKNIGLCDTCDDTKKVKPTKAEAKVIAKKNY